MKKKSKRKVREKIDPGKKSQPELSSPSVNKEFDFGGLPERNLKKNLGCG